MGGEDHPHVLLAKLAEVVADEAGATALVKSSIEGGNRRRASKQVN